MFDRAHRGSLVFGSLSTLAAGLTLVVVVSGGGASTPPPGAPAVRWVVERGGSSTSVWTVELETPGSGCARARIAVNDGTTLVLEAPCSPGRDAGLIELATLELRDDTYLVARVRPLRPPPAAAATSWLVLLAWRCGAVVRADLGADVVRPGLPPWLGGSPQYDRVVSLAADRRTVEVHGPGGVERWRADGCALVSVER